MQYFGGKFRVRKPISGLINSLSPRVYLEPFCGSAWVAQLVNAPVRICSDLNSDLIALWQAMQNGWDPPTTITPEEYQAAKLLPSPHPLRAFCGFGCSFAGKYWGGYARGGHGADAKTARNQLLTRTARNYAANSANALNSRKSSLATVKFECSDYETSMASHEWDVAYLDPPYRGTTKYYGLPNFDYDRFWDVVREYSCSGKTVLVSEYSAPDDFESVLDIPTRTDIRNAEGQLIPRVERVFRLKGAVTPPATINNPIKETN